MPAGRAGALKGLRIVVPPSRVAVHHPLAGLLTREGADVVVFPAIVAAPPPDEDALRGTARDLEGFDWAVVSGRLAAENLLSALTGSWPSRRPRVVAIGSGAAGVLRGAGLEPCVPKLHTAGAVAASLGDTAGKRVVLVRGAHASGDLPARLRSGGAEVSEIAAFAVRVDADSAAARDALGLVPAAVALANPTAVRLLVLAARGLQLGLAGRLRGAVVAAAGPATARTAKEAGISAALVADGHLGSLVALLVEHFRRGRANGHATPE